MLPPMPEGHPKERKKLPKETRIRTGRFTASLYLCARKQSLTKKFLEIISTGDFDTVLQTDPLTSFAFFI